MSRGRVFHGALVIATVGVLGAVASAFAQTGAAPDVSQIRPREAPIVPDTQPNANEPVAPNRNRAVRPSDAPIPDTRAPAYPAASAPAPAYGAPGSSPNVPQGFFPPQPRGDLSLTHMGEVQPAAGTTPQAQAVTPQQEYVELQSRLASERYAEQQAERAERDNQLAQQRRAMQPAPINGAFTGLTDERDR